MIRGLVHNNRPLVSLVVAWKLGVQEIVALVDTGFTGELGNRHAIGAHFGL